MDNPWKWIALVLASVLFGLALFGVLTVNFVVDFTNGIINSVLGWFQFIWPR